MIRVKKSAFPLGFKILECNTEGLTPPSDLSKHIREGRKTILEISGGGIKGVFSTIILWLEEEAIGKRLCEEIKVISATSVGSIEAAWISSSLNMKDLVYHMIEDGVKVFKKSAPFTAGKYSSAYLEELLRKNIGDITFKELYEEKELILNIQAYVAEKNGVRVNNDITLNYRKFPNMKIRDAVRASMAAPYYFQGFAWQDKDTSSVYCFFDGGTSAVKNCSVNELINYELYEEKTEPDNFFVLSVGTGKSKNEVVEKEASKYFSHAKSTAKEGVFRSIKTVFDARDAAEEYQEERLSLKEKYEGVRATRINPPMPHGFTIDSVKKIDEIVSFTMDYCTTSQMR